MSTLFHVWNNIQNTLFPWLEEALDPLSEKKQKFVQGVSLMDLETHMKAYRWQGKGRKRKNRISMVKEHCGEKLAGHISRDAPAIAAREKPVKKKSG